MLRRSTRDRLVTAAVRAAGEPDGARSPPWITFISPPPDPAAAVRCRPPRRRVATSSAAARHLVARAHRWAVTDQPFADLDELLALAGLPGASRRRRPTPCCGRLVDVARHRRAGAADRAAAAAARGCWRSSGAAGAPTIDGSFEELIGAAWLAIHAYRTDAAAAAGRRQPRARRQLPGVHRAAAGGARRPRSSSIRTPSTRRRPCRAVVVRGAGDAAGARPGRRGSTRQRPRPRPRPAALSARRPASPPSARSRPAPIRNHRDRTAARLRACALVA